jgi:hypothetical protein
MMLLITASARGQECASELTRATRQETRVANSLRKALGLLRAQEFSAVVIDQIVVDAEPAAVDGVLQAADTAIPVFVNFALSRCERVVSDVRAALVRRERERMLAMRDAETRLRSELNGAVTGILLSSELALAQPSLPAAVEDKLKSVHQLASQLRSRLKTAS